MGIFNQKNKSRKSKMKKDGIAGLNSNNVNNTTDSSDGGANVVENGAEAAIMFDSMLLVQLLLPLILATLIWGRKWIYTRALLQLDRSCISVLCPSISKRERLLRWTSEQLPNTADSQLRTFWLDGSHLCTLINSVVPGACANPHRHWRRAPTHAQALAYKYLGIIPVFTDADFKIKTMTPNLERKFQNYLTELQVAISKISQQQKELKWSHSHNYIVRGMGLTTGEQHRKNFLYIYPTDLNRKCEDIIITMKGPYNTYGSVVLRSMNLLNESTPYKNSVGKEIQQQCENFKRNQQSLLRSLSIDLTNIMSTGIAKKEHDTLDFNIKFEKGRAKVAYISDNNGIHELCITTNGEHISGSPYNINIEKNTSGLSDTFNEITNKQVYKTINRKVIKREIDFINEKSIFSNNNLYKSPIMEESTSSLIEAQLIQDDKIKLIRQENLEIDKDEESTINVIISDHETKVTYAEVEELAEQQLDESIESISNVAAELELLVEEEILAKNILEENNSEDLNIRQQKDLLSERNELLNCSSDLSNIELEELEDTELSEPASIESTNKLNLIPTSNNKVNSMNRKQHSKLCSDQSIYCSSEFSTNSIELERLEDLSSDEFLYFGQDIFLQENKLAENSSSPKENISVKERIVYYNKSPRENEDNTKKIYTVNIPELLECSTFEPDILSCHTVKYSEITTYPSPIWKHIVQEEIPNQDITSLNTSSEIDQESNVLNTSPISSYSTNKKNYYSSDDSCLEENNNSNNRDYHRDDLDEYPQPYYNKSSEEFTEMFRKRRQFWDRISVENSSGCSSDSSLSNPIISSYTFYNNRRLSSEKFFDSSNNFHRSLDCFQSQQCTTKTEQISDDDLCKSTDDLAFPSVKDRKLLFIKEMNNHWSKDQIPPVKVKYLNSQKLKISEKVLEQEVHVTEALCAKISVQDQIKIFNKNAKLKQPILQVNNTENLSKRKYFIPIQPKKLLKSEPIVSNKENFKKAQSYFKTLTSGKKTNSTIEFNINQIERRHSIDCESRIKKWEEAENRGGSLPRVSEKFPLDNIYKDVLGDRKNTCHLKGSANKVGMIVTLHSMPEKIRELDVESEFKEELFYGQKKFKDRPKLNSVFPIHY